MLLLLFEGSMHPVQAGDLVFEVIQEADGGYIAECLTENIVTQADTWEELRANVKDAVEGYFFDGPKPRSIRLHLVRDEVLSIG
jgi:predicted RNase H-like HicB family nuclease